MGGMIGATLQRSESSAVTKPVQPSPYSLALQSDMHFWVPSSRSSHSGRGRRL